MSIRFVTLLFATLAFALGGCPTRPDPLACMDACSHQEERTFCDIDGVYPGTELKNECIVPPSPDACNRVESCTLEGKPYCTDDSMGVCVECVDGSHCGSGEVCDENNECIVLSCTPGSDGDAACVAADPSLPFCGPDEHCVACLESVDCSAADSPVCDSVDLECRGCIANSECDSKVCETDTGMCADEANIIYVSKAGTDGDSCGTLASPCATITEALLKVTESRDTVVVGAGSYPEHLKITDVAVLIVADGIVAVNPHLAEGDNVLAVSDTADVTVQGLVLAPASGVAGTDAISCSGATASLTLHTAKVTNADDVGVTADLCSLIITGSTISGNRGGGINISNSDFTIVNNFIVRNGTDLSPIGGIKILNSEAKLQEFAFNTIANNRVGLLADATNFEWGVNTALVATGTIIYGGLAEGTQPNLDETNCSFEYSNIEGGQAGDSNIDEDPLFVNPIAGTDGDYHLQSTSPCINAADPAATLDVDIDGESRPKGGRHDMGADEAG